MKGRRALAFDAKQLPGDKARAIVAEFGEPGREWVVQFPELVTTCVERWRLRLLGMASEGLPINLVFFAEGAQGEPLVLKLGYPHPEQVTEMIALAHYAGHCAPRLVDCSRPLGATLMEWIQPGNRFRAWGNNIERSRVALTLMGELPRRCDDSMDLPRFEDWLARAFDEFRHKFERNHPFNRHIDTAETVYAALRGRYSENWLLHGDLHHENILMDRDRGWIAIDPKGVIGPRPMECGRFLHNFLEDEIDGVSAFADASIDALCHVMDVRVATLEQALDMPRRDLLAANYVDAVLSFCWTVNSRPEYSDFQPVDAALEMLGGG